MARASNSAEVGDLAWKVLVTLYLAGIVSANALAAKLVDVFGVTVTVGALGIPLVYLTTDTLNELYGPKATRDVVWMGFGASLVLVALSSLAVVTPSAGVGAGDEAFGAVFQQTPRIVVASMCAYLSSSLVDVRVFSAIKRRTGDRAFWLRKNASTAISQLADTLVFVVGAFALTLPASTLAGMVLGQYLVKMVAAPLGTPLSYGAVALARRA